MSIEDIATFNLITIECETTKNDQHKALLVVQSHQDGTIGIELDVRPFDGVEPNDIIISQIDQLRLKIFIQKHLERHNFIPPKQ